MFIREKGKSKILYVNVIPIVNRATATYFNLHVINARAITNIAGQRFPKTLNNFLVCVRVKMFFRMNVSAIIPEMLIFSQNII